MNSIRFTQQQFDDALVAMLREQRELGVGLRVVARDLHRAVVGGSQPNRMPMACRAMWKLADRLEHTVVHRTASGRSSSLEIEYHPGEVGIVDALPSGTATRESREPELESEGLSAWSGGNSTTIRLSRRLDGRVSDFGRAFWDVLAEEVPHVIVAMARHPINMLAYTDRYLLTPMAIRLLFEVVENTPGLREAEIAISTARLSTIEPRGRFVYDAFASDTTRKNVLQQLFPTAAIDLTTRTALPHDRRLRLRLGDRRNVFVTLDQGFGAWRAAGRCRHDFGATPERQARALRSSRFDIRAERSDIGPVVVETKRSGGGAP